MDTTGLRAELIGTLRASGVLTSDRVAAAIAAVPRETFLPEYSVAEVYTDQALVTKRDANGQPISSSSQPSIMARMLEQLDVRAGMRIMEIGAGTGYNAALLDNLAGPDGGVVTVDIDEDIVQRARTGLAAAGHPQVRLVCADGVAGWPAGAPYDRIMATVGIRDIYPQWIEQLRPGGLLLAPLDVGGVQRSIAFRYNGSTLTSESVVDCGFMRLRGSAAGPERSRLIDAAARRSVLVHDGRAVDEIAAALTSAPVSVSCGLRCTPAETFGGLLLWLSRAAGGRVDVHERDDQPGTLLGDTVLGLGDTRIGPGIVVRDSVALLVLTRDGERLVALGFGPQPVTAAGELVRLVSRWDAAGRPSSADLRVTVHPRGATPSTVDSDHIVERPNSTLVLSWR